MQKQHAEAIRADSDMGDRVSDHPAGYNDNGEAAAHTKVPVLPRKCQGILLAFEAADDAVARRLIIL